MGAVKVQGGRLNRLPKAPEAWIIVLLWLGLALRLIPLVRNPLHQDEALYGFWGRLVSTGRDPWLATVPVDKPPLGLYLIAGSQVAFGVSEFSARLPGLAASLLSIPLTYALARRLYGRFCGLVAATVMTLTPYPLLFGATAFTDPVLVACWLAACCAALRGRWGWAGLTLGLAWATKQQAVVLAPLVIGLAALVPGAKQKGRGGLSPRSEAEGDLSPRSEAEGDLSPRSEAEGDPSPRSEAEGDLSPRSEAEGDLSPRSEAEGDLSPRSEAEGEGRLQSPGRSGRGVADVRFVVGLGLVVAVVLAWDRMRMVHGAAMGFWGQGVESYGGLRLIWPAELIPRLRAWARLAGYLLGWPWLGALLLVGIGALLVRDLTRQRQTRLAVVDLTLITFALFYLFSHLLVAFPVWDRYLLPMAPVMGLLVGRVLGIGYWVLRFKFQVSSFRFQVSGFRFRVSSFKFYVLRFTLYVLLFTLLVGGGVMAARGRIPVGGDHEAYDGLKEVMDYLRTLPVGTVLYDRWLSWHYDYYLFDAYLYRAGFPSPGWLAADAAAFYDGRPRYLVLPGWESSARLERALAGVGLTMSPVFTTRRGDGTTSFVVWEIGE